MLRCWFSSDGFSKFARSRNILLSAPYSFVFAVKFFIFTDFQCMQYFPATQRRVWDERKSVASMIALTRLLGESQTSTADRDNRTSTLCASRFRFDFIGPSRRGFFFGRLSRARRVDLLFSWTEPRESGSFVERIAGGGAGDVIAFVPYGKNTKPYKYKTVY